MKNIYNTYVLNDCVLKCNKAQGELSMVNNIHVDNIIDHMMQVFYCLLRMLTNRYVYSYNQVCS